MSGECLFYVILFHLFAFCYFKTGDRGERQKEQLHTRYRKRKNQKRRGEERRETETGFKEYLSPHAGGNKCNNAIKCNISRMLMLLGNRLRPGIRFGAVTCRDASGGTGVTCHRDCGYKELPLTE